MTPTELVKRVQMTVVKARSNAAEAGLLDSAMIGDPVLFGEGELSLLEVTERMLADREPTAMEAYNLLILADRSPGLAVMYGVRWEEDLPEPMEWLKGQM